MESEKTVHKHVSDLGSGAYLLMHGYKALGRDGRDIVFEITESKWRTFEEQKNEYLNSEFHRFDACLMSLKKSSEYVPLNGSECKKVNDLGAAAYAMAHGFKFVGREGKSILFQVVESEIKDFQEKQLEFIQHDCTFKQFDSCIMSLKRIGYYEG